MARPSATRAARSGRQTAAPLLLFGFLLTFLSGFGQTFFIGLYGEELRQAATLSHRAFGAIYSVATLTSAGTMIWAGALLDRVRLPGYVIASALLLAGGYLLLPLAGNVAVLGLVLFLLRFGGQGLLPHTSVTSVARFAGRTRGRSLAISLLGHPAGEAALPPVAVFLAAALGWRSVWLLAAGLVLAAVPLLARLAAGLRRIDEADPEATAPQIAAASAAAPGAPPTAVVDRSRRHLVRDVRFYLLVPSLLAPAFTITGVFFHQTDLVAEKGWPGPWFATLFIVFAAAQTTGMLGVGPLIDRLRARRLVPLYLVPLGVACVLINLSDHRLVAIPFMAGAGITMGSSTAIVTSMWVETWGARHLGANRALASSIGVLGAALAPAIFGGLIELGVSLDAILLGCAAFAGAAALLALLAAARRRCEL